MPSESGKVILLTGATRGLGRALADRFAESGHRLFGCGRDPRAVAELNQLFGAPHHFAAVDVADDREVAAWAADLLVRDHPPDLLINNAALINPNAHLWDVPAETIRLLLDVNVAGPINVIRHFLPAMIARGSGVVVNLSSYWGRSASPEVGPYCATKWAIEGLTRSLSQEIPKTLAAVALNPGIIDTDMLRSCFGEAAGQHIAPEPWSRAAAPFILQLGPRDNGKSLTVPGQ